MQLKRPQVQVETLFDSGMRVSKTHGEVTEALTMIEGRYDAKYVLKVYKAFSMYASDCLYDETQFHNMT